MKQVTVVRYDAFANRPGMGNPCGIIFDADSLTTEEMQQVAAKAGFNECAFLCSSDHADLRLRFFMPAKETSLCGHGTVCAISALMSRVKPTEKQVLVAETMAGDLTLQYDPATSQVIMQQANAIFEPFEGDLDALLASIGLDKYSVDHRWPVWYGSTGSWTLILPISGLGAFETMKPQNKLFEKILTQHPDASVHPITPETFHLDCVLHGRHFSSSSSGSVEDPVTGTASGVMAAYYLVAMAKLHHGSKEQVRLKIEQGQDMGKDGVLEAAAQWKDGNVKVEIAGSAVSGDVFTIEFE